jgi:ribosomal-protein-alanine N-acetyltransferase
VTDPYIVERISSTQDLDAVADHDLRRQGLATALMRHLLADAAKEGAIRALLEVRRSNNAALQLYESLGFVVAGVRRNYYTHPEEDALVLQREGLSAPP